ncbi:hypothetical protein FOZ63_023944 [Perkinsus olseni]|uniref:Uncharacterized protein n=1 Tax=Perkinsus olseni TaxID=32597 RepID=A0A7J6RCK4_PEROL|nr:hypothetical protein FOZ63_023944 [Perkinsus olseni]
MWTSWSFLTAGRPTLSPLCVGEWEGYICGLDGSCDFDGKFGVMTDRFGVEGNILSICADRDCVYFTDMNRESIVRVSLSSDDCVEVIPLPPSSSPFGYVSHVNCVSNGHLFAATDGDRIIIRTRLTPFGERHEQSVLGRVDQPGFGWEAVDVILCDLTDMDVIVRSDGKFQLVYVGYDFDVDEHYIYHIGYEGNSVYEPCEEACLCRFVPSNDELLCVVSGLDCDSVPWISLMDIWSMSVFFVLNCLGDLGNISQSRGINYLTALENARVVVGQQKRSKEHPSFIVMVWELC